MMCVHSLVYFAILKNPTVRYPRSCTLNHGVVDIELFFFSFRVYLTYFFVCFISLDA